MTILRNSHILSIEGDLSEILGFIIDSGGFSIELEKLNVSLIVTIDTYGH